MPLAAPVDAAEFAASMARLGPWDAGRQVAVAVSGGADSLALTLLAAAWGAPVAFIVDHGLRAASAQEAEQTLAVLTSLGIPTQILKLTGLQPGPGMPGRARKARYAALDAAAAKAGLVDLLLGHHAGDQAETILMRQRRGSGMRGLAGMASVTEGRLTRRLRPLLHIRPERLRATLMAAGLDWVEDPTNRDHAFTRARLRMEIAGDLDALLAQGTTAASARYAQDAAVARVLAERASLFPEGYALLTPGPIDPMALGRLLQAISGRPYVASLAGLIRLARAPRPATLGGVRMLAAGRLGPGWLLVREASAMAQAIPLHPGAVWDQRFRVAGGQAMSGTLGARGAVRAGTDFDRLPSAITQTLPAIRTDGVLCATGDPAYIDRDGQGTMVALRHDGHPACGAAFQA